MEDDDDEEPKNEGLEKMYREEIEARLIELFVNRFLINPFKYAILF